MSNLKTARKSGKNKQFLEDVLAGLSKPQKVLQPKYFYDEIGSDLFDQITELPEYYPTGTELGIMTDYAPEMAEAIGELCLLIELGGGSLVKVRMLLEHLREPAGFVPLDVSGEHLNRAANSLKQSFPKLPIMPVTADFTVDFQIPKPAVEPNSRVVYFPGSTIGNLDTCEAERLLSRISSIVRPVGGLLIGIDLRKDPNVLRAAYDDSQGVTAAFNLNLLERINRELDADFDVDQFRHKIVYNESRHRIEMHLESITDQYVHIAQRTFRFRVSETIHTENSHKFDVQEFTDMARPLGLHTEKVWTDNRQRFAVIYMTAH